jgi:hypothetical protein
MRRADFEQALGLPLNLGRHVGSRIAAELPIRPYSRDRHMAWLRRRAF